MPDAPRRVIAHLDCDAFFATVELLRRPELRGKPVIVAGNGPRSVVTTASYEARVYGVGSAMPAATALRLCPHAVVVPPDHAAYSEASRRVWDRVDTHLDRVQRMGIDEAYADLTGTPRPVAVLRAAVADVLDATGVQLSVGLGPSRLVAKCCSDVGKPAAFTAMGREEAARRFASAGVTRLPGIGPRSAERLAAMGIVRIGELQQADPDALAQRFGERWGRALHALAWFHDDSPVVTDPGPSKSVSSEVTFDEDITDAAEMEAALQRLSERLGGSVRRGGRRGRTVAIKVRLSDWTTVTRARTLPEPVDDVATIADVARDLLRQYAPPQPVRLLGVRLAGFADDTPSPPRDVPNPAAAPVGQMSMPRDHPGNVSAV